MSISGLEAASLLAGGAKPRELRSLLASNMSLSEHLALSPLERSALKHPAVEPVEVDLGDAHAITLADPTYPLLLRAVSAPPPVLFVRGDLAALRPGVAVVGTREPSGLGDLAARLGVEGAAAVGAPVHSGLARGVDTLAHREALRLGVPTVMVVASGVDAPSPAGNVELAETLLQAGGALVSEQLPGTEVSGPRLQARNRIIAGLSRVVVVAEASLASGTMGTVRAALGAHRSIVVPRVSLRAQHLKGAEALLALANPHGCDPDLLGLQGNAARNVPSRSPLARAVSSQEMVHAVVEAFQSWSPPASDPMGGVLF